MTQATSILLSSQVASAIEMLEEHLDRLTSFDDRIDAGDYFCPARLREAMQYSLLAPGKRLRPMLVLLAAEACGRPPQVAMPAACAVEMMHCYSLIHDDLPAMDDDDLRRGRPSCHKKFDEATAILAGDALLTRAFEVLAREVDPPTAAARCCAILGQAAGATALVGGQSDDLSAEDDQQLDSNQANPNSNGGGAQGTLGQSHLEELVAIHARKTAALLRASVQLGGVCAGAAPEQLTALDLYGRNLGLAFQIMDDLLDVRGDEASLGKRVGKDSGRGKLTYPGLLGQQESQRRAEEFAAGAMAALAPLGQHAESLEALARFVVERDR